MSVSFLLLKARAAILRGDYEMAYTWARNAADIAYKSGSHAQHTACENVAEHCEVLAFGKLLSL